MLRFTPADKKALRFRDETGVTTFEIPIGDVSQVYDTDKQMPCVPHVEPTVKFCCRLVCSVY